MSRQIQQAFDKFHQARRDFVQATADFASKPENITKLMELNVLALLRPLLLDIVPSIQQYAALCLGRLAEYSEHIAQQIVKALILPEIVAGLSSPDHYYNRHTCFVIRAIAKHSATLAQATVDAGCLCPLVQCLQATDERVCEEAAHALGFIASHSESLAKAVVDSGAIPNLMISVKSKSVTLRRLAVASLGDIAQHSPELAEEIIKEGAISIIAPLLKVTDSKLKACVCSTLAHVAKHNVSSAQLVIEGNIFPNCLKCLGDSSANVRRCASSLVREIAKHTQDQAQLIVDNGGAAALVDFLRPERENDPLNAVLAIGFISCFSQSLATAMINEDAHTILVNVFQTTQKDHVKADTAWALGQLGKHSPEHASHLTRLSVLELLLESYLNTSSSDDLKLRSKRAMKLIIEKCAEIEALQPLIERSPDNILTAVLAQISKLLPKNPKARVPFMTSGGFQAVQRIQAPAGSKMREYIDAINSCYPDQAVRYHSPQYPEAILAEVEASVDSNV